MGGGMAGGKKGGDVPVPFYKGTMAKRILDERGEYYIDGSEISELIV
jgi:hypothetical protein